MKQWVNIFEKIRDAEIDFFPFPHFVIRDFFSPNQLNDLRRSFPKEKIRQSKMTSKSRYTIVHESRQFNDLLNESLVWKNFYDQMSSDNFVSSVRQKYTETSDFSGDMSELELVSQMDITFASSGYKRSIHLDRGFHFFNSFIYLNGREEFSGEGGDLQFHKVKNPEGSFDKFPDPSLIEDTKTLELEGNTFVGFFCSPWSYHSVVPMKNNTGTRDFVYCALNAAGGENLWPEAIVFSEERRKRFISE